MSLDEQVLADARRMAELLTRGQPPVPGEILREFREGRRMYYLDAENGWGLFRGDFVDKVLKGE